MTEEWRPVFGFEDRYLVSSEGRVASLRCTRGLRKVPRVMKPKTDKYGYFALGLTDDFGQKRFRLVHALVCEAWHGPRPEGLVCRHRDGSTQNNVPSNLIWGTMAQNKQDSIGHGTWAHGERSGRSKLSEAEVIAIRSINGRTQQSIADEFGVSGRCIQRILADETWRHLL